MKVLPVSLDTVRGTDDYRSIPQEKLLCANSVYSQDRDRIVTQPLGIGEGRRLLGPDGIEGAEEITVQMLKMMVLTLWLLPVPGPSGSQEYEYVAGEMSLHLRFTGDAVGDSGKITC